MFESDLDIRGVLATDLFTFNASLGATIEQQVVDQLNRLRTTWDPTEQYALYRFERQPQTFPDVVLRTTAPTIEPKILMGIELKGWYALAKEREPSFRYAVSPAVCAEHDLLAVFPWALSAVVSGSPRLFDPFVVGARYAAEYRNWHWEHKRKTTKARGIRLSGVVDSYPTKDSRIDDKPDYDEGGNFGRVARTTIMDEFTTALFQLQLSGISLDAWQRFFRVFAEGKNIERRLDRVIESLAATGKKAAGGLTPDQVEGIKLRVREVAALLNP